MKQAICKLCEEKKGVLYNYNHDYGGWFPLCLECSIDFNISIKYLNDSEVNKFIEYILK